MKQTLSGDPAVAHWYQDVYGSAVISRNRWFLVGVIALTLAVLEAGALIGLAPLKAVEPYVIQVGGAATAIPVNCAHRTTLATSGQTAERMVVQGF